MSSHIFDRISFWSLFLVITLLPVFFLPFTNIPVETSKGLLLVVGLAVSVIFWGFGRFFDGKIVIAKSLTLLAAKVIVLVFFLSALFSQSKDVSLFGTILDTGSFWFIFAGFLMMFMSSIVFKNPQNSKLLLFGAIISSSLVLIFQILRLFLPQVLSLGVFLDKTGNVFGAWNSLGLFCGFTVLMSLIIVEFFSTTKVEKAILAMLIVLAILLAAVVNFALVWVLIGGFSLIIFIYKASIISREKRSEEVVSDAPRRIDFPAFSFSIIVVSLIFFISGNFIGGILPNRLGISNSEVSPSLSSTILVTKSVIKSDPLLGVGPNRFGTSFAMHKSQEINTTVFWDTFFNSGSGLLPTLVSTTGVLGLLAWLLFFILFIFSGAKSIFSKVEKDINWERMAFFVLALYLFVSTFFYSTGSVIFLLALAFAGVFVGLSAASQVNGEMTLSFLNDHRKSFFSMLFLVMIIIIAVALSFKYVERLTSVSYFGKTVSAPDVPSAERNINKALSLHQNDLYLRTYAQVYLIKLNSLVGAGAALSDDQKGQLQLSLDQAVNGAKLAISYDPKNYLNFQTLGSVYQTAASLGVKDGYIKAIEEFKNASTLNPNNPGIKLAIATASFANGGVVEAKEYANIALILKPDYADALVVLSQIAKSEGDGAAALAFAERALALYPTDANLIQYVGSLKSPTPSPTPAPTSNSEKPKNNPSGTN